MSGRTRPRHHTVHGAVITKSGKHVLLLSLMVLGILGCTTTNDPTPLSEREVQKMMKRAHDPRRYSLTVYNSDAGPVYANANRLHPGQHEELPFRSWWRDNAPVIEIHNRYKKISYLALVDTSSKYSWIDLETYQALNAIPLAPPAVPVPSTSVSTPAPGFVCTPEKLIWNELHMETPLLWFRAARDQLGPLTRGEDPDRVHGIMGNDMLKAFAFVSFDFKEKTLTLNTTEHYAPDPTRLMASIPYKITGGQLLVEGALEGSPSKLMIDTAGDFQLAMPEPLPEKMRLVSVAGIIFQNPELVSTTNLELANAQIPRIGRGLLIRYLVTLDNKRKVIHLEKPAPRRILPGR